MDQTNNGLYNILRDTFSGSVEVDPYYKPRTVTALAFANNGDVITGDSDGQIMVWSRSSGDLYTANKTLTDLRAAHKVLRNPFLSDWWGYMRRLLIQSV